LNKNKYPDHYYFTGFVVFYICFHLLGSFASSFSDGVLLAALWLLMKGKRH